MSYENARKGISKVFSAEVLQLIAALCGAVAGVLGVVAVAAVAGESTGGAIAGSIGVVVAGLAALVLSVIGIIMLLVGLNTAGKDSEQIKKAFTISIVSLIVAIVVGILKSFTPAWVANIGDIVATVLGLLITYNVLFGCAGLNSDLAENASSTWKVYMCVVILDIVIVIVTLIMGILGFTAVSVVAATILVVADAVLEVVAYIMFLVFLSKAKNTL